MKDDVPKDVSASLHKRPRFFFSRFPLVHGMNPLFFSSREFD